MNDKTTGTVYLVGGGPGDPKLLTIRAVEVLRFADVILYDRLVNPLVLEYAPAHAQKIYAGKEPNVSSRERQTRIHQQLIQFARQGLQVVRLKGGDPFVFGRGGEECLALSEAQVPFEVIPGISSAVAAPAYAGIPVTHRGVASAFAVFAGRESAEKETTGIDWEVAARIPTAVFLMGVNRLSVIVEKLQEHGRPSTTPIAVIERATLPNQRIVVSTLKEIHKHIEGLHPPAVIVVGDVGHIHFQAASFRQMSPNEHIPDFFQKPSP